MVTLSDDTVKQVEEEKTSCVKVYVPAPNKVPQEEMLPGNIGQVPPA